MNTLQDIAASISRAIKLIEAANQGGLNYIERNRGTKIDYLEIRRESYIVYLKINNDSLPLSMGNFDLIARHFDTFFFVVTKAIEFLQAGLQQWEKDKDILAPFVLQEKITR